MCDIKNKKQFIKPILKIRTGRLNQSLSNFNRNICKKKLSDLDKKTSP